MHSPCIVAEDALECNVGVEGEGRVGATERHAVLGSRGIASLVKGII